MVLKSAYEYLKSRRGNKIIRLKKFLKWFRKSKKEELKNHPIGKSRRVITEILIANNYYEEKLSSKAYPVYKPRIKRYYPGAQMVIDGSPIKISLNSASYDFNLEMSMDMKGNAITSYAISDEETAEAVCDVIKEHKRKHGSPLSILMDNSSANLSQEVSALLEKEEIEKALAFVASPETKGLIEGEFSKIKEQIYPIRVGGKTEKELARSILVTIMDIYTEMKNKIPHCDVCLQTPLDLMNYKPTKQEKENAQSELAKQRERSEAQRKEPLCELPSEKENLILGVIERNRLEVLDIERFIKTMGKYDKGAIEKSEEDFYAYSCRESFQETKRNGQYFAGIVRNKQLESDQARKKELLKKKYFVDETWKQRKEEEKRFQEQREAEARLKKYPEKEVKLWLIEGDKSQKTLGRIPNFFLNQIRKGITAILSKQNWKVYLDRLKQEIMAVTDIELEKRLDLVKTATRWVQDSKKYGVKSVTLF